jgi:concanavalin A-like lectin/glucanase superfamily protein
MSYSTVVYNDAPTLWWQLNDSLAHSTSSVVDASGNDVAAVQYNVQFKTPGGPPVTGMACATFSGLTGGYGGNSSTIQSSYNPDTYLEISLECWVNFPTVPVSGNPKFIASSNTAVDNYGCEFYWASSTDTLHFSVATASATGSASCSWTPVANTWYHLVATWDGAHQFIYINGVLETTSSFTPTALEITGTNPSSPRLGFGCGYPVTYTSSDMFTGLMSNVAVYDYSLTQAQVTAHYVGVAEIPIAYPINCYTTNLCPNPSLINDRAGYVALTNTGIALAPGISFTGKQSLVVETDGIASGEGVMLPSGVVPYFCTGSVQLRLLGASGNLTVNVFTHPSSVSPLASVPVTLSSSTVWQPIVINGLNLFEDQEIFVTVTTSSPQITMFWVDTVQYEPESPAHPYIDGTTPFCEWVGVPGSSPSFQQFQFPMGANGSMNLSGRTVIPVDVGKAFHITATAYSMDLYSVPPYILSTPGVPAGAFNDFAFYQLTDPDPAMSYVSWNNAGTSSGQTNYSRIYGLVSVPVAYEVSNNQELWASAQYLASGYQAASLGAGQIANITQLQAELMPYQYGTAPTPSTYDTPRAIHTIIKPTRMNYCTNPSGAISTAGWYLLGSATTLAQSSANSSAVSGALDSYCISCQIISTSGVDGLGISIGDLILGDTYTVSAWVMTPSAGFLDVTAICSGGEAQSFQQGTAYGTGQTFNSGPYGGVNVETDMADNVWYNPTFSFVAEYSTVQLLFQPVIDTATFSSPVTLNVDAVMVEPVDLANVGTYFDGGFGSPDYMWETGGTAGLARSYYYLRHNAAVAAIPVVIADATPQGLSAATPLLATPPTQ